MISDVTPATAATLVEALHNEMIAVMTEKVVDATAEERRSAKKKKKTPHFSIKVSRKLVSYCQATPIKYSYMPHKLNINHHAYVHERL